MNSTMPHLPLPRRRRARAGRVVAALGAATLMLALTGCTEHPPLEGTVTFKTIERPTVQEECTGVPSVCDDVVIPTVYRVEVTYPDKKKLFPEPRDYYRGKECWFDVEPDEYQAVKLGDKVKLGNPANEWGGPGACELAQDLAPNSYVPQQEGVTP